MFGWPRIWSEGKISLKEWLRFSAGPNREALASLRRHKAPRPSFCDGRGDRAYEAPPTMCRAGGKAYRPSSLGIGCRSMDTMSTAGQAPTCRLMQAGGDRRSVDRYDRRSPDGREGDAVLAAVQDAPRRLRRWPKRAILDRGCARRHWAIEQRNRRVRKPARRLVVNPAF
jgi:hypothetical protein